MKKALTSALLSLALGSTSALATTNLSLYGGSLRDGAGNTMADGGLILLVASTTDSIFSSPLPDASISVGSLFGGDDQIVGMFEVSALNSGFTGGYGTMLNINYSGNLTSGDALQLYWFPSLTLNSTSFGSYTPYGTYRTDSIASSSDIAWALPSDGTTVTLNFFTSSTGVDGAVADSFANASLSTVPEPATTVALLGGAAGLFVMHRRRSQRKQTVAAVSAA